MTAVTIFNKSLPKLFSRNGRTRNNITMVQSKKPATPDLKDTSKGLEVAPEATKVTPTLTVTPEIKPVVMIARDAFAASSYYDGLIVQLHAHGYSKVVTPHLPSVMNDPPGRPELAFSSDVTVLHDAIAHELHEGRDVVLLCHGYGGVVGTEALFCLPTPEKGWAAAGRFLGIVFVAAAVPLTSETYMAAIGAQRTSSPTSLRSVPDRDSQVQSSTEMPSITSGESQAKAGASTASSPHISQALTSPPRNAYRCWKKQRCVYVRLTDGMRIGVETQDKQIARLKSGAISCGLVEWEVADDIPFLTESRYLARIVHGSVREFQRLRAETS